MISKKNRIKVNEDLIYTLSSRKSPVNLNWVKIIPFFFAQVNRTIIVFSFSFCSKVTVTFWLKDGLRRDNCGKE